MKHFGTNIQRELRAITVPFHFHTPARMLTFTNAQFALDGVFRARTAQGPERLRLKPTETDCQWGVQWK